jgi:hypothetical protein
VALGPARLPGEIRQQMNPVIEDMACQRESLGPACGEPALPVGALLCVVASCGCLKVRSGHGDPKLPLRYGSLKSGRLSWTPLATGSDHNDGHIIVNPGNRGHFTPRPCDA